ncbi:uncharacterized protein [Parasteatoda tepidariorum]|uniref:uncharacterized protein n=1 Tax=Parasteatoda tepidariorum TaxID=114398 RepID=UPI0039BD55DA
MGIGGSTSSRPTTPISMNLERPKTSSSVLSRKTSPSSVQEENLQKPTDSCCSHFKENHVGVTRTVTPVSRNSKANSSIDDEIEEIVANTLDIVSNQNNLRQQTANLRDTDRGGGITPFRDADISSARSRTVGQKRLLRSGSLKTLQKRPSDDSEFQFDAKESLPEVDFAKFKKVNHQGATIQKNGRIIHHQESDLLWRLGLVSPEAYKINTGSRSAPSNQGAYLKTPSYDLTEEQLMANIEKEFECIS